MIRLTPRLSLLVAALVVFATVASCGGGGDTPSAPTPTADPSATKVSVQLKNFEFIPKELTFNPGESVEFTLRSLDIDHTFTVTGLPIDWRVGDGKSEVKRFQFVSAGQFKLFCDIPGHEGAGMVGRITVR
jgi:plastocyanin